ncbi:hypothetical protein GIS00_21530 [Nakamurella sp. YIM 132087]|uniref:Transglutaminase-like domain-containing protein n=1 Tax=Nakamurella alba TaxID=2665158 RepID=A0A7K1FQU6_9ACTN|nr:DUF3488 and transglutaminase-like domain-containing protein [Nakamurella alba]MTD16522.1 hypothetical protein [Nakamurella alba]
MTTTLPGPAGPPPAPAPPVRHAPPAPTGPEPPAVPERPLAIVPCLVGAAAIIAGSSALGSIISGTSWLLPLVEVVLVVTLIGIGGRMIRFPAAVTVLVQLIALSVALTALFTSSGYGGVIPNFAAAREAGTLLAGAWEQILGTVPPADSTPELGFLIAAAVGLSALIVDFLIAEAQAPALVALPLLCLYSVPASMADEMLPWYAFAAPAALYALLLAVAGQRGRHTGMRAGFGLAINGTLTAALAVVAAVGIAGTVTVIGTEGKLPQNTATTGEIGLSPFTSLSGDLIRAEARDLLTVSGLNEPEYLRTTALTEWTNNQGWSVGTLRNDGLDSVPGPQSVPTAARVQSLDFRDRFLPAYKSTTGVSGLAPGWGYDAALGTFFRDDPLNPVSYTLEVDESKPTADDLAADTVTGGGVLTAIGDLPQTVRDEAERVTAAQDTPFGKAQALQEWFTNPANGFVYSLSVPQGNSGNLLVDFLDNKQGYCEQYASAMAVMLRSLDIPARVAIGFTQGELQDDGSYVINSHDAHAWVEVLFDNYGWIQFDPTPLVNGQGGLDDYLPGDGTTGPSESSAAPSESAGADPSESGALGNPLELDDDQNPSSTATQTDITVAGGGAKATRWWWPLLGWILLVVVVLAAILLTPSLIRRGRRRRRLALATAGGPGAAGAAWAEIEDSAIDHGLPVNASESARVTANRLAKRAHLDPGDRERLRGVVLAAEWDWYGAGDDPAPAATDPGLSDSEATVVLNGAGRSGAAGHGAGANGAGANGAVANGADDGAGGVATLTAARPRQSGADHARAATAVVTGLDEHVRLGPIDKWWPRSLRMGR